MICKSRSVLLFGIFEYSPQGGFAYLGPLRNTIGALHRFVERVVVEIRHRTCK